MLKQFLVLLSVLLSSLSFAQLELKEIMKGNEFIGHQPTNINWSANGELIYFSWNPNNEAGNSLYRYDISTKKHEIVPLEELSEVIYADDLIEVNDNTFINSQGNLYSYDKKSNTKKGLIYTNERVANFKEIANDKLAYKNGNNIYTYCIKTGAIAQITDFKKGSKPTKESGEKNFLENQQTELFEFINLENAKDEHRKSIRNAFKIDRPLEIFTEKMSISNQEISFDGNYVIFRLNDYPKNKYTQTEYHVTENGYAKLKDSRAKVGAKNPTHKLAVYQRENDTVLYLDFSNLSGIYTQPKFLNDYNNEIKDLTEPKNVIYHGPYFNEKNNNAVVTVKSYDNKDRWICLVDCETGKVTEIDHQHDEAWIGGPIITGWNGVAGKIEWTKDNTSFIYSSEKTGFSHLYKYNIETKSTIQLTNGEFEIHDFNITADGKSLLISANKKHLGNREFYLFNINSKTWTDILTKDGNYEVTLSPNKKDLAVRYSYKNKPWELYTSSLKENAKLNQVTESRTDAFKKYEWRAPEVIAFKASDNQDVYARLYKPEIAKNNHAAVIFVHGAGYLQNAHNWFSGYYREYMFHNLLVDMGYTVLDIDYRASKGYGRDCRTATYRHMGGKDLSDQIDGKKYLVEELGIDNTRVGIYGGSYGGFITIMGMLTTPDEFACGAAIRSVTDWAHYNHQYTSNILNTPETDPKAFKKSSPIYFADNLKGDLLMLHGMVDDNVQFMDVTRLSQRFIELGKQNWEMAVYPVEPHGFVYTSSWVDEYGRILKLFNRTLLK